MSRKKKNKMPVAPAAPQRAPEVMYRPMDGGYPYPVAPASNIIQLPPIVQPIVMVPFSSQQQPVATFIDDEYDDEYDY